MRTPRPETATESIALAIAGAIARIDPSNPAGTTAEVHCENNHIRVWKAADGHIYSQVRDPAGKLQAVVRETASLNDLPDADDREGTEDDPLCRDAPRPPGPRVRIPVRKEKRL